MGGDSDQEVTKLRLLIEKDSYQNCYSRLSDFMIEHGSDISSIRINEVSPEFRYVTAKRDIRPGQTILYAPRKLVISHSDILKHPKIAPGIVENNPFSHWGMFGLFLLFEREDPESFWRITIDVVPFSSSCFPVFYTQEER